MVKKVPIRTVPFTEWPAEAQLVWQFAIRPSDPFEDTGPLSHVPTEYHCKLIAAYGRWLGFLEDHAGKAKPESDRQILEAYIDLLSGFLAPHTVFSYCRDLLLVLRAIRPQSDLTVLGNAVRNLARTRRAVTDKRSRLVPAEELYELGHQLMHDSGRQDKALKQAARCCQTNANLSPMCSETPGSCCQLTPLGQRGGAVLLECVAAVEMTVEIEVVVDRSVNGRELLQGLDVPEFRHRPFPSSERLM